ncbi:hypothetical protein V2J09_003559 [Rumex salicifolius]
MESIKSFLSLVLFGSFTLGGLCLVLPPYWLFKILSFLIRSLFPEDVKGKVVLITGASSGIGEHVAYEYAKRGARLALAARRKDRLTKVAEKARELGSPDTLIISADVSIPEHCEKMIQETVDHFGTVDHLVNNAGITTSKLLEEYSDIKEMESIMDTNFWGSIHSTRYAIPHLRRSKGKIVVMSSAAYWVPSPRVSIYSGSKGALISLFEGLRVEMGSDVKITLVSPGFVESEITTIRSDSGHNNDEAQAAKDWWISYLKTARLPVAKVEECATAIVRSACRGDRYVTEPNWVILTYYVKLLCPELLEFSQRLLVIDFVKKFM